MRDKMQRGVRIEITGPMASGKTTTAALVVRALREAGFVVSYEDDGAFVEKTLQHIEEALQVGALAPMPIMMSCSIRYKPGDEISPAMARNSNEIRL